MTERPDWQRAFEMMGTDGVNPVTVLLAPDGQMYAVLQGEYAGELRTIKLDDEGRISAFVIDSVDAWGRMLSVGNAELAVRLGSPVIDEQRGRVQYIDTFEEGTVRWQLGVGGTDGSAAITPLYARSGGYAVMLRASSDLLRTADMANYSIVLPNARTGFAYSFSLDGGCDEHTLEVLRYDGVNKHDIRLKFDDVVDQMQILNDVPAWVNVLATDLGTRNLWHFHSLKLVVDLVNHNYLRLILDNVETDLSMHAYAAAADARGSEMTVRITQKSMAAANDIAVVDNVIITTAEPE